MAVEAGGRSAVSNGTDGVGAPIQEASPRKVHDWLLDGSAVLIDVREPDEHAREHIQSARLLPLSSFDPQSALSAAQPGQRLVIHCRSGGRSLDACQRTAPHAAGRVTLVNMTGGINAWKHDALPVQVNTSAPRLSLMRQVQIVIGAGVLLGAALTWLAHPAFISIPAFFGAGLLFAGATGTCALASLLGRMPWNRATRAGGSCSTGPRG